MKKRTLFIMAIMLLNVGISFGATLPNDQAAKELANRVVEKFVTGDVDASFAMLKAYSVIDSADYDAFVAKTKSQMDMANQQLGVPVSSELVDQKKIGDTILRLRYLEKHAKSPVVWTFIFYKATDGWILNAFYWNGDYMELFLGN